MTDLPVSFVRLHIIAMQLLIAVLTEESQHLVLVFLESTAQEKNDIEHYFEGKNQSTYSFLSFYSYFD